MRIVRVPARDAQTRTQIEAVLAEDYTVRGGPQERMREELVLSLEGSGGCAGGLVANYDGDWLFIDSLVVDEMHRGRGHGARLLIEAERIAADRAALGTWLVTRNARAARFYARLGYRARACLPGRNGRGAWHVLSKRFGSPSDLVIRNAGPMDTEWLAEESTILGGPVVVSGGDLVDLRDHPARIATDGEARLGFTIRRRLREGVGELLAIRATTPGGGVGRRLIEDLMDLAKSEGCHRIETDTTNDNTAALRFYQQQGFRILDCRRGAFAEILRMKGMSEDAQIRGNDDIPIRDVFRLSLELRKTTG